MRFGDGDAERHIYAHVGGRGEDSAKDRRATGESL